MLQVDPTVQPADGINLAFAPTFGSAPEQQQMLQNHLMPMPVVSAQRAVPSSPSTPITLSLSELIVFLATRRSPPLHLRALLTSSQICFRTLR